MAHKPSHGRESLHAGAASDEAPPHSQNGAPPRSTKATPRRGREKIAHAAARGVETAYRLIDEHVREGRQMAQELNRGGDSAAARDGTRGALAPRSFDLFGVVADLVNTVAHSDLVDSIFNPGRGEQSPGRIDHSISVAVSSRQPIEVTLQLRTESAAEKLALGELRPRNLAHPPLDGATLISDAGLPRLRIDLADSQPPDVYFGEIARDNGESCGTLTIRVGE